MAKGTKTASADRLAHHSPSVGATVRATGVFEATNFIEEINNNSIQNKKQLDLNGFGWRDLDKSPELLSKSFELRYHSYCLERGFLDAKKFPSRQEVDEFDRNAIHMGVFHSETNLLTATARIVLGQDRDSDSKLPIYNYCEIDEKYKKFLLQMESLGEISRFVMSRSAIDRITRLEGHEKGCGNTAAASAKLRNSLSAILTLYKSIYQASRLNGIPVLVAAMEQSLRRLVTRYSFPFHQIGPEVDYFGPVAPFMLDLDELDDVLFDEAPWLLVEFYRGLEDVDHHTMWFVKNEEKLRAT